MSFASVTPGLVPHVGVVAYIVLDDFGKAGRVYREAAEADATLESIIDDLLTGQFNNPLRVVAFNTSARKDGRGATMSEDVAREVLRRLAGAAPAVASSRRKFIETYVDEDELLRCESGVAVKTGKLKWTPMLTIIETRQRELARPPSKP